MDATRYTSEHEWITVHGGLATVGITKYAAEQLGEVVFVDFPEIGKSIAKGKNFAVVESTKTAADVYAPVTGEVVEINTALQDNWETIDSDSEGAGWIARIRIADAGELDGLMDEAAYKAYLAGL